MCFSINAAEPINVVKSSSVEEVLLSTLKLSDEQVSQMFIKMIRAYPMETDDDYSLIFNIKKNFIYLVPKHKDSVWRYFYIGSPSMWGIVGTSKEDIENIQEYIKTKKSDEYRTMSKREYIMFSSIPHATVL